MKEPPLEPSVACGIGCIFALGLLSEKLLLWSKCFRRKLRVYRKQRQDSEQRAVYDNVTLEDDVFCGPNMVFTNVYNPRSVVSRKDEYRNTTVERGATLGANCTIVCGTRIGQHVCGCRGRGNRDVKPFALMVGCPPNRSAG